eukprot:2930614-Prymnesium_polylepis.1
MSANVPPVGMRHVYQKTVSRPRETSICPLFAWFGDNGFTTNVTLSGGFSLCRCLIGSSIASAIQKRSGTSFTRLLSMSDQ